MCRNQSFIYKTNPKFLFPRNLRPRRFLIYIIKTVPKIKQILPDFLAPRRQQLSFIILNCSPKWVEIMGFIGPQTTITILRNITNNHSVSMMRYSKPPFNLDRIVIFRIFHNKDSGQWIIQISIQKKICVANENKLRCTLKGIGRYNSTDNKGYNNILSHHTQGQGTFEIQRVYNWSTDLHKFLPKFGRSSTCPIPDCG